MEESTTMKRYSVVAYVRQFGAIGEFYQKQFVFEIEPLTDTEDEDDLKLELITAINTKGYEFYGFITKEEVKPNV